MTLLHWPFLLALGMLTCFGNVQGLKCLVCDMGMRLCKSDWSDKDGMLMRKWQTPVEECEQSAISCALISVQTKVTQSLSEVNDKEGWLQRMCLYPGDLTCIGKAPEDFPLPATSSIYIPDWISCMNSYRKSNSIPEIKQVPSDSYINIKGREVIIDLKVCKNATDKCNNFFERMFPVGLAEGFPMDLHEQRKKGYDTKCYACSSEIDYGTPDSPESCKNQFKKETAIQEDAYGCTMLAIYQIAGGLKKHDYFERDLWLPGDEWCLKTKFNSDGTGRTLEKADVRYFKRSTDSSCTQADYFRALKGRVLDSDYEWIADRKFYSPEEFAEFVYCREHVTNKLKILSYRVGVDFNESTAAAAWAGKSGVFAWVGFRFCGPGDLCNHWSEHVLYEKMNDPPSTSTTTTPKSTTDDDDSCNKKDKEKTSTSASLSNAFLLITLLQSGVISSILFQ